MRVCGVYACLQGVCVSAGSIRICRVHAYSQGPCVFAGSVRICICSCRMRIAGFVCVFASVCVGVCVFARYAYFQWVCILSRSICRGYAYLQGVCVFAGSMHICICVTAGSMRICKVFVYLQGLCIFAYA